MEAWEGVREKGNTGSVKEEEEEEEEGKQNIGLQGIVRNKKCKF